MKRNNAGEIYSAAINPSWVGLLEPRIGGTSGHPQRNQYQCYVNSSDNAL